MDDPDSADLDPDLAELDRVSAYVERLVQQRSFICPACGELTVPGEPVNFSCRPDRPDEPMVYHAFCGLPR
jgi:hypothetical protein